MASSSDNLLMRLLNTGESAGGGYANWGEVANADLQMLEDALCEISDITVNTSNVTLSDTQFRSAVLRFSGTLTGNRNIIVPARKSFWFIWDFTVRSGNNLTIKMAGQTGVALPENGVDIVYCDGTDVYSLLTHGTGAMNRVMRTTDLPKPTGSNYTFICKDNSGNVGTAQISVDFVTNFTILS